MMTKEKIAEAIIKEFEKYRIQLCGNKKVSEKSYRDMATAISGCKYIVKELLKNQMYESRKQAL